MTLFFLAQTILGTAFVIRTLSVFRSRALVNEKWLMLSAIFVLSATHLVHFFTPLFSLYQVSINLLAPIFYVIFLTAIESAVIKRLREMTVDFFGRWILNLKLGMSVNSARESAFSQSDSRFVSLMRPVFEKDELKTRVQHLLLSSFLTAELRLIEREKHMALTKLEACRALLRAESEFRRKSGQAARQASIQSLIMLALWIAMVIFSGLRHGFSNCLDLFVISAAMMGGGFLLMNKMARKKKWKI